MRYLMYGMWLALLFIWGCTDSELPGGPGGDGDADSETDTNDTESASADADSDADSDGDSDGDADSETTLFVDLPDVDDDSDGYTNLDGDCHDLEPRINPDAMEDLGEDGLGDLNDNDCDGFTDELEPPCDTELEVGVTPDYLGESAADLAAAINLCDDRYLLGVEKNHSWTETDSDSDDVAYDTFQRMGTFGCFEARQGFQLAAIATGPVWQANANQAEYIGDNNVIDATDPRPLFQGETAVEASTDLVCDVTQFRLHLRAPVNAYGFTFDFLFASAEYDEYLNQGWNDTFYGILEYAPVNGGETTNITFDSNGSEIEVDANFFENTEFACDERMTGWDPNQTQKSGSTGWLRTAWTVTAGDEFHLTFSIHDEGDEGVGCGWDSIALIDNFQWILEDVPFTPGTTIIGIE